MASNVTKMERKPHKADRQKALAGIKMDTPTTRAPVTLPAVGKGLSPATETKSPAPVVAKTDTPPATPKKKRVWSPHHLAWKALEDFKPEQRIVVIAQGNPKKRNSAARFDLYKRGPEGMTVGEYIEVSHKAGNTKAIAKEDVKWDYTAGFITIDGKKAPPNVKANAA